MKFVFTSDWHADAKTAGFERFEDVRKAAIQSAEHAIEIEADGYFMLGDLADPDSPNLIRSICLAQEIQRILADKEIWSYWLVGNHDVLEDGHGTTVLDPLDDRLIPLSVYKAPVVTHLENRRGDTTVECMFLPYTASGFGYDPEEFLRANKDRDVRLIVMHLMLEGIGPGSETEDFPRGRDVFFPIDLARELFPKAVCVAGHYHKRQTYRGIEVVGSLARLTRGEASHDPCFLTVEI